MYKSRDSMQRGTIRKIYFSQTVGLLMVSACLLPAAEPHVLQIDFAREEDLICALHGINKRPLAPRPTLNDQQTVN